jgi:hypothetical protein
MPLRIDRVNAPRAIPARRRSSGVPTQIFETPWKISDHSKQHVHRCRLDVPSGFPTRDCIGTKPQEPGELGLGETEALPDRENVVR